MWSVQRIRNTRYVMVISGRYNSSRSRCYIWSECYHLYYAYEVFFRNGLLSRVSTLVRGSGQLPALGLALTPLFHFLHHHKTRWLHTQKSNPRTATNRDHTAANWFFLFEVWSFSRVSFSYQWNKDSNCGWQINTFLSHCHKSRPHGNKLRPYHHKLKSHCCKSRPRRCNLRVSLNLL